MVKLNEKEIVTAWNLWYPKVYGYFYKRVSNIEDVEELTANTLNAFLLHEVVENQNAFIWKIARNQLLVFIAGKPKELISDNLDLYAETISEDNYESPGYKQFKEKLLQECKKILGHTDYEIVLLSISQELTSNDIAIKLHIKAENVRQRYRRSLQKIKPLCAEIWSKANLNSN